MLGSRGGAGLRQVDHDRHGLAYRAHRRADPRIEARVLRCPRRSRRACWTSARPPSATSSPRPQRAGGRAERDDARTARRAAPAVDARAEQLPFDDDDLRRGDGLRHDPPLGPTGGGTGGDAPVASGPVVVLTFELDSRCRPGNGLLPRGSSRSGRASSGSKPIAVVLGGRTRYRGHDPDPRRVRRRLLQGRRSRPEALLDPVVTRLAVDVGAARTTGSSSGSSSASRPRWSQVPGTPSTATCVSSGRFDGSAAPRDRRAADRQPAPADAHGRAR